MFKFWLLFAGVAFLKKLDTTLRQKTDHFKAKNVHFNWIGCAILRLKMSADIIPLLSYMRNIFCLRNFVLDWIQSIKQLSRLVNLKKNICYMFTDTIFSLTIKSYFINCTLILILYFYVLCLNCLKYLCPTIIFLFGTLFSFILKVQ